MRFRLRNVTPFVLCLGFFALTASAQDFDFDGYYDPANWTTTGTGSVDTSGAPSSITLIGPDAGSAADLDFTIEVPASGNFSFNWAYNSTDSPGFDHGGWLLNGVFTELSDTSGESGSVSTPVSAGDIIGFSIISDDGLFDPGTMTITNFSGPLVPEPASLGLLGAAGLLLARRRR